MNSHDARKSTRRGFLQATGALVAGVALGVSTHAVHAVAAAGKLKIGVIGSGRVGGAVGGAWVKAGHAVMFSSLDIEQDKALAARLGGGASAGTPRQAAEFGEVLLVSVPYSALPQLGKDLADAMRGKVVIDTSNPFPNRDGEIANWAREKGAGLATAELLPGTRIVRAFNSVGFARMAEAAQRPGPRFGMPIAGDDAQAISVASRLIHEVGYEPVLVGPLAMGRFLMPGTPLAGEQPPEKIRAVMATLK